MLLQRLIRKNKKIHGGRILLGIDSIFGTLGILRGEQNHTTMNTHGEQLQNVAVALTAEKIGQISGKIDSFLNEIRCAQDALNSRLRRIQSETYRSAKIISAAYDLIESLHRELSLIAEKKSDISEEDLLRVQHILDLIDAITARYTAVEAEYFHSDIPEWLRERSLELIKITHKFLGYLEGLRCDNIIANNGKVPEDIKALYDDFRNKLSSYAEEGYGKDKDYDVK